MSHIRGEVLIRRPVEEVFDLVADERNEPTYNPNMVTAVMITDGPIGVGTRFSATVRTGRRASRPGSGQAPVSEFGYEVPAASL